MIVIIRFEGVLGLGMSKEHYRSPPVHLNNHQVGEFHQKYALSNNLKEQMKRLSDKFRVVVIYENEKIGMYRLLYIEAR